jgi:membrane protease YdiL (CAAX protease family)
MQGPEVLIPLTLFAGGFAMVFGIVYLKTRENLAMVEKGMNPREKYYRPAPYRNLKWGLLLIGAGLGLLTAYILSEYVLIPRNDHDDNPAIYFSLIAIGGGLGLISSYRVEKKELIDKENKAA